MLKSAVTELVVIHCLLLILSNRCCKVIVCVLVRLWKRLYYWSFCGWVWKARNRCLFGSGRFWTAERQSWGGWTVCKRLHRLRGKRVPQNNWRRIEANMSHIDSGLIFQSAIYMFVSKYIIKIYYYVKIYKFSSTALCNT